jgi:hypothetical protein
MLNFSIERLLGLEKDVANEGATLEMEEEVEEEIVMYWMFHIFYVNKF